jgi:hypothetical protein
VRQAIKLGYTLVAYDPENATAENRDGEQARSLYKQVLAKDPQAKLFVHVGYSHIDKAPGNLGGDTQPMAMQLKRLSGDDPLCVDQVQFRDVAVGGVDFGFYNSVASRFVKNVPFALRARSNGAIWSSDPRQHDVTVVLPPVDPHDLETNNVMTHDVLQREVIMPRPLFDIRQRPPWLTLGGKRVSYRIPSDMCAGELPCAVDAYYPGEPDDATPADRYTFVDSHSRNDLYLYPGRYRLRAWDATGKTLHEEEIEVPSP